MRNVKLYVSFFALFTSYSSFALELNCTSLQECLENYQELASKKYLVSRRLKGKDLNVKISGDKEKLDQVFSFLLYENGYTRVSGPQNLISIIETRDIRYSPVPLINSDNLSAVAKNYDYFMVSHKLRNKHLAKEITRSLRPYMSRYGRIIFHDSSGHLTLQDTGLNIHRLLTLVDKLDIEFSSNQLEEFKREMKKEREHQRKIELIRAKK